MDEKWPRDGVKCLTNAARIRDGKIVILECELLDAHREWHRAEVSDFTGDEIDLAYQLQKQI